MSPATSLEGPRVVSLKHSILINWLDWLASMVLGHRQLLPKTVESIVRLRQHPHLQSIANDNAGYVVLQSILGRVDVLCASDGQQRVHFERSNGGDKLSKMATQLNRHCIPFNQELLKSMTFRDHVAIVSPVNRTELPKPKDSIMVDLDSVPSRNVVDLEMDEQDQDDNPALQNWDHLFQSLVPLAEVNDNLRRDSSNKDYSFIHYNVLDLDDDNDTSFDNPLQQQQQQPYPGVERQTSFSASASSQDPHETSTSGMITTKRLLNEEIDALIMIKDSLVANPIHTTGIKKNINSLLGITDVESAIRLMEINELEEQALTYFINELVSLDLSYIIVSVYFRLSLLPRVLTAQSNLSRDLYTCLKTCFIRHHTSFINAVLMPLFADKHNTQQLNAAQTDLVNKLLKDQDTPTEVKMSFIQKFVITLRTEHPSPLNDNIIQVMQTVLNLKLQLDDTLCGNLLETISQHSKACSKNMKFDALMMSLMSFYSKQVMYSLIV
ncbi:hypothetical protein SAMD00019534_103170 [Acytostelium subglobosum LB1]|uniref:hypothetical protein n=1 Tax=Acytostelium subglobosum LB1 TaxID=1410327 RepID=UPI000644B5E7|nr:hypothetical protein SAMD00019534_103170 [Acytostelium subglobosum LB1]GAM27142.1 hypothetical protein SAMD00019534_103170 [Acytostelium subglobosum LB1]|eukprot:XP_012750022.1 hypothetical protein SAMD00019534_103170 [Acytostelium subglobosum LB1]